VRVIGEVLSGEDENEAGSIGAAGVAGVRAPPRVLVATGLFEAGGNWGPRLAPPHPPLSTHTHPSFAA
jgi:hypothetical protein